MTQTNEPGAAAGPEKETARVQGHGAMHSVVHATFELQRTYDASAQRVFEALSDEAAKSKWFSGAEGRWQLLERHMDLRVGGRERLRGRWDRPAPAGTQFLLDRLGSALQS